MSVLLKNRKMECLSAIQLWKKKWRVKKKWKRIYNIQKEGRDMIHSGTGLGRRTSKSS